MSTASVRPKSGRDRSRRNDTSRPIFVNCRIAGGSMTGVHRYLAELLEILGGDVTPIQPNSSLHGFRGHAWEQFALPFRLRGLLWSPSNTGPIGVREQVVTIHDVASLDHSEWFQPAFASWYRYVTPRLVRGVRRVITVSEFSKERIVHHTGVDADRIIVIPNGVARRFRPPSGQDSADLKSRYPALKRDYLLYVGSLEPRKNLGRLFAAWNQVRRRIPDVTLVVAGARGHVFSGSGYEPDPVGVTFIGKVADLDLPTLYGTALAFVYPSVYEGFGLPPLEAMACGTPVVVSRAASMPGLVGNAAILVDPFDVESIADGLRLVVENRALRDDLRRLGRDRSGHFTWERTASETRAVLEDAARSNGTSSRSN